MKEYNVLHYGAAGDGKTNDAFAIQHAIDDCAKNGGGRVVLQSGHVFYSDSIQIKKNVDLHIQKGASIKATSNIDGYIRPNKLINDPKTALIGNPVTGKPSFVFIYGYEADHCTISGEGTIDANGHAFVQRKDRYYVTGDFYPRPTVMYVEKSNHITFKDFTVVDAPFWTLHPAGCDDVLIDRIRILNDLDVANSDGIDPDHCTNVRILGCHVTCADDCICLKTSKGNSEYGPTENVVIDGCTLISTSAAVKIGTEGVGDFRNIIVSNCTISKSNRGLSIQIRDGGNVENVTYLALEIFDSIRKLHGLGKRERLLLQIGVILHSCGAYVNMEQTRENSYKIIMSTEIIGISHKERVIVANILRYNSEYFPPFEEIGDDISREEYITIVKLCAILKLANVLDKSNSQKIRQVGVTLQDSSLLIVAYTMADITLEKGLFHRKADVFEEAFGIRPVLKKKNKRKEG